MQQMTINCWSHIRNLKHTLIAIPIGLVIGVLYYLITNRDDIVIYIFGSGYILTIIPVILIHLNYYKTDKDKIISIDKLLKSIEITDNITSIKIDINEINRVIMTTGLEKSGSSIWSGYFYYQMDLINGQTIFITSLLLKAKDFPFIVNLKRRTAFPFTKYFDYKKDKLISKVQIDKEINDQIDSFYKKYSDYSIKELNEIIDNKKIYENSAVKAAERLINEKNYGCQQTI